eukprot:Em0002g90a
MKERHRQHLETLRRETITDSNFYVSCRPISQGYVLDKKLYRKIFTDYNIYFTSYIKIRTLTPDTAVERKLKLLIDNTCSSNYHVPSGYHKLEKSYRLKSGYDPSSISTYNIIAENKFHTLERIDKYSRSYHPYTKSKKYTPENKNTTQHYYKVDLLAKDGQWSIEGDPLQCAPQWAKVFLVSLGRAQLLRNALHLCNTLSTKELRKRGSLLAEEMSRSPKVFTKYFDLDEDTLLESLDLVLNYGSTAAVNSMLIFMGKIKIIRNAICTISTEDLMMQGVYLIRQRLHNTPDIEDIEEALHQNKYSPQLCCNTAAFIETCTYDETVQLMKSELEQHYHQSQDELSTSDMNSNGHDHEVINELSSFVAIAPPWSKDD